jgi:hypothetical protein
VAYKRWQTTFSEANLESRVSKNSYPRQFPHNNSDYISNLPQKDIDIIIEYLKGPTKIGLWAITPKFELDEPQGIIKFLKDNYIKPEFKEKGRKDEEIKFINEITQRLSFILSLFYYIHLKDDSVDDKQIEATIQPLYLDNLQKIDIEKIKSEYSSAYRIFNDEFYFEEFSPILTNSNLFFFKNHHCSITRLHELWEITSTNHDSIKIFNDFLIELHIVKKPKIVKLFSPAESVFSLYTYYLELCYFSLFLSEEFQEKIGIAISEFNQENYSHCINTLGIFTEGVLIQIFETLFRRELDKKRTMGELFYYIQEKVQEIVSPQHEKIPVDIDALFKEVEEILKTIGNESNEEITKKTLQIIRKIIQYGKTEKNNLKEEIKRNFQKDGTISIFPNVVYTNFNELKEYRNAISHKSKIQINRFEAVRSFYCSISLYTWWQDTKNNIDWHLEREEIIKKLVENKID